MSCRPRSPPPARHDPKVIVEAAIVGRELECGVLELPDGRVEASTVGEIRVAGVRGREDGFYDFATKYLDDARRTRRAGQGRRRRRRRDPAAGDPGVPRASTARAWPGSTSSSPTTARWSTRSTRCRASPRSRCTRGCGRPAASTTRRCWRPWSTPRWPAAPACADVDERTSVRATDRASYRGGAGLIGVAGRSLAIDVGEVLDGRRPRLRAAASARRRPARSTANQVTRSASATRNHETSSTTCNGEPTTKSTGRSRPQRRITGSDVGVDPPGGGARAAPGSPARRGGSRRAGPAAPPAGTCTADRRPGAHGPRRRGPVACRCGARR